jgi:hypothetical protein
MIRLSAGSGISDTLVTHEPVANGDYLNVVGELKGSGINNLSEGDMNALTQDIEERLFKEAFCNKDSKLWATNQIERRKKLKIERAEKERTDTPKDKEGKLIPQIGLSKYEQTTGLKRRRGTLVIMVANGEDLDHIEAAYEALAARKTITIELENITTTTLNMATKEDKAKRGMLTQKENEIQDNINVIMENRNQFKIIAYKGYAYDTISNYRKETNDVLATQRSPGKVTGIEHHTTSTPNGDMEIYIITVSSPKDRDLILGLSSGTPRLTYSEDTARGSSLKSGRKEMLQVGQLNKGGTRVTFKTNGSSTGMNTNPRYMKAGGSSERNENPRHE